VIPIKPILPIVVIVLAGCFIGLGIYFGDFNFFAQTATYGNFDVPGTQSWIMKLFPGTGDYASEVVYGTFNQIPLIAIGILFLVTSILALYLARIQQSFRSLVQWTSFAIARLGVFRVSGLCPIGRTTLGVFPFLNCMGCEMATGACPIGTLQWSLIQWRFPFYAIGLLLASGIIAGRAICGWLCPFGFIADIFNLISLKKIKLTKSTVYLKYGALASLILAPLSGVAVFCLFCESGIIYGLVPYYLTTGRAGVFHTLTTPWWGSIFGWHVLVGLVFIILAILISGRWFCRVLCPLGAIYGIFNPVSIIQVTHDDSACNSCNRCQKHCPMSINLNDGRHESITSCIRCGRCTKLCKARKFSLKFPGKE
jgi:ferredoxin-type protein NapH